MQRLVLIAIAVTALPAASRAERRIAGSFQQLTHDCRNDDTVDVAGRASQITYRRAVTRKKQTLVTSSGPNNVIKREK